MIDPIKILFFGDFVSKDPYRIILSSYIKNLMNNFEIKCCNFEAPVENKGSTISKSGISITQSVRSPKYLEELGFNIIQLANNHIFDYGHVGYKKTKTLFNKALLIGAGSYDEAYKVQTMKVKDKIIGFLALTHYEFGVLSENAKSGDFGAAWINHPEINNIIAEAKKNLDYLFVMPHAGVEYIHAPLPEWRQRYKEFIKLGADGVIASHPHVPQGWEIYKEKPIFYSLGNFYFDVIQNNNRYWNKGLILELELSGKISFTVHNLKFEKYKISEDNSESIESHNAILCNLLNDEMEYLHYINEQALKHWKTYADNLKKGLNTFNLSNSIKTSIYSFLNSIKGKQNIPLLINLIRCESHRWFMLRALDLLMEELQISE